MFFLHRIPGPEQTFVIAATKHRGISLSRSSFKGHDHLGVREWRLWPSPYWLHISWWVD